MSDLYGFKGERLAAHALADLRALIIDYGPLALASRWQLSESSVLRAAAGARILAGTRVLIMTGVERMRRTGELRRRSDDAA
jgi:hypothetical protein